MGATVIKAPWVRVRVFSWLMNETSSVQHLRPVNFRLKEGHQFHRLIMKLIKLWPIDFIDVASTERQNWNEICW